MAKHVKRIKETNKRSRKTKRNAENFKENERRIETMLQTILDIILYIPGRIYMHFYNYRNLKEENKRKDKTIHNQNLLLTRIKSECEYNMQINNYSNSYAGFRKIKELAETFPNDN